MWIFTNRGFISAVKSDEQPDTMIIRARNKAHLTALLPEFEPVTMPGHDYARRVFISTARFGELMTELAASIDYGNFKNSIQDDVYHHACSDVWGVMYEYQQMTTKGSER